MSKNDYNQNEKQNAQLFLCTGVRCAGKMNLLYSMRTKVLKIS